jgi:2-haloacid dehalogenase
LADFNKAWHPLSSSPDTRQGLHSLKSYYVIPTLPNDNVTSFTSMGNNTGLPWDAILSAELADHYKPDPRAYLKTADLLGITQMYW